jgi:hypothetical protein
VSGVIRWQDPPPERNGGHISRASLDHVRIVAQLKGQPRRWALISVGGRIASNLLAGRLKQYPREQFEAVERQIDGERHTFVRYIGEPQ